MTAIDILVLVVGSLAVLGVFLYLIYSIVASELAWRHIERMRQRLALLDVKIAIAEAQKQDGK